MIFRVRRHQQARDRQPGSNPAGKTFRGAATDRRRRSAARSDRIWATAGLRLPPAGSSSSNAYCKMLHVMP